MRDPLIDGVIVCDVEDPRDGVTEFDNCCDAVADPDVVIACDRLPLEVVVGVTEGVLEGDEERVRVGVSVTVTV